MQKTIIVYLQCGTRYRPFFFVLQRLPGNGHTEEFSPSQGCGHRVEEPLTDLQKSTPPVFVPVECLFSLRENDLI